MLASRLLAAFLAASVLTASASGQGAKQKTDEAPRLPPRLLELLKSWSSGYELDGRRVAPTLDASAMANLTGAPRPVLKDIARRACYAAYAQQLSRGIKPPAELERVAKACPTIAPIDELAKVLDERGFPDLKGRG